MTTKRVTVLLLAAWLSAASPSWAEPELDVTIENGVVQLNLRGSYGGSHYSIWRAPAREGPFTPITALDVLCIGSCFGDDATARPGTTYWYRFDIERLDGASERHGPFPVTIPAPAQLFNAGIVPNPSRAGARVELFYSGAAADPAVPASAVLFDLQGRRRATLWNAPLRSGVTRVQWNGKDDAGRGLDPGQYFLRYTTPRGTTILKVLRLR